MSARAAFVQGKAKFYAKAMANCSTPAKKPPDTLSSFFITPPVSVERKQAPPPADTSVSPTTKIPPLFPTPEETPILSPKPLLRSRPKLALEEKEDLLSGLYAGGYQLLTKQILDYLEPCDLYNVTLVCSRWTQLTVSFPRILTKIRGYSKYLHRDTENMNKPFPSLALCPDRKPLGDAKNRLLVKNASTPSLPPKAIVTVPKRVMYKHRHCPRCRAASKQLNLRRAECTNCKFDYCSLCLKSWHNSECERQKSPKRASNEISAGSKRSKKNLKRL